MKEKIIVALFMVGALGTTLMINNKLDHIDNEVGRFMTANRLTETNLKELDEKIGLEKYNLDKKAAIKADRAAQRALDDAKSQTSNVRKQRPETAVVKKADNGFDDLRSQKSIASKAPSRAS